jgi:hypothetical protein
MLREMATNALPDPVPLGVSGTVKVPLREYAERAGRKPERGALLLDDSDRVAYIARRLSRALDQPLTAPGSAGLARTVLGHFSGLDVLRPFAEKALETLRDGNSHNRTAISPQEPHAVVLFVAWNGTHREIQPQRFGNYLKSFLGTAGRFIQQGIQIGGFLEIDAYVRDNAEPTDPTRALDEVFEIDVEYSYMHGSWLGSSSKQASSLPDVVMLNPDLCDPEENQLLKKLMTRSS